MVECRYGTTMLAFAITAGILAAYVFFLWWMLRNETWETLLWLAVLCTVSLAIRVVYTEDFPSGFHEDEPKILGCVANDLATGRLFGLDCTGLPVLLNALFQAQLVPLIGAGFWTIRLYSLVTSVLSSAAGFAVARALGLRISSSLGAAALIAVLPWSVFWGRISMGGELPFHQLLLVAAIARLVWVRGGPVEVVMGSFGLSLLLWDYFGGRSMLAMPFVGLVLASRWRRLACLAIFPLAVIGWMPHAGTNPIGAFRWIIDQRLDKQLTSTGEGAASRLLVRIPGAVQVYLKPTGADGALTVAAAGMHPAFLLVLALVGSLTGVRRFLFLWGGFAAGFLPAILSNSPLVSVHQLMMSLPFISLAAASALNMIPFAILRRLAIAVTITATGVWSLSLYFSDQFWTPRSRGVFNSDLSTALASITPNHHPPAFLTANFGYFASPFGLVDKTIALVTIENLYPPDGPSVWLFSPHESKLLPFYMDLFGPEQVRTFGRAFTVSPGDRSWAWLRRYGWHHEKTCVDQHWSGQVPVLYHVRTPGPPNLQCTGNVTHRWDGRWLAGPAKLRLGYTGDAVVSVNGAAVAHNANYEANVEFDVAQGDTVSIRLTTADMALWAGLTETREQGDRVPLWGTVEPVNPTDVPAPPGP